MAPGSCISGLSEVLVVWRKVERFGEYEITVEHVNRFSPGVRANDIVVRFRNVFPIKTHYRLQNSTRWCGIGGETGKPRLDVVIPLTHDPFPHDSADIRVVYRATKVILNLREREWLCVVPQ